MRRLIAIACATGCYAPTPSDCTFTCQVDCPAGLICVDNFCRTSATPERACGSLVPDGPPPVCNFAAFPPTRIDPCAAPYAGNWNVTGTEVFDTTNGGNVMSVKLAAVPPGPLPVRLVRVETFSVAASSSLTITGDVPLVIVARSVDIEGTIDVHAGVAPETYCVGSVGITGTGCGSGGGGGGFGATGGRGGACNGSGSPLMSAAIGDAVLTSLIGGCNGGAGHSGTAGGRGGGALQISALERIVVSGTINAAGGGGDGGQSASGGGGGGAGGAIFLEAPSVMIASTGRVCANGGAGGEGSHVQGPGGPGTCDDTPATSPTATNGGDGGNGGYRSNPAGANGGIAQDGTSGGGGGGGSVGRIRIRTLEGATIDGLVSPTPTN